MERLPGNEQESRRKWLVGNLASRGETDPEVQEALGLWVAHEETERQSRNEPNYILTMELARIFEEAGLSSICDYYLDIAYQDAFQAGDEETCQKIGDIFKR